MTEIYLHFRCAHYGLYGNAPVYANIGMWGAIGTCHRRADRFRHLDLPGLVLCVYLLPPTYTSRPVRPELSGVNLRQNYGKSRSFDLYAACQFWNTVALEEARPACDPGLTELAGVGQVESELGAARTSRNRRRCAATRRFIVNWSEENSCSAQSKPYLES